MSTESVAATAKSAPGPSLDHDDFPMKLLCATQAAGLSCELHTDADADSLHLPNSVLRLESTRNELSRKKGVRIVCGQYAQYSSCKRGDHCPFLHVSSLPRLITVLPPPPKRQETDPLAFIPSWRRRTLEARSSSPLGRMSSSWPKSDRKRQEHRGRERESPSGSRRGQPEILQKLSQIRGKICHLASLRVIFTQVAAATGMDSAVVTETHLAEQECLRQISELSDSLDARIAALSDVLGESGGKSQPHVN